MLCIVSCTFPITNSSITLIFFSTPAPLMMFSMTWFAFSLDCFASVSSKPATLPFLLSTCVLILFLPSTKANNYHSYRPWRLSRQSIHRHHPWFPIQFLIQVISTTQSPYICCPSKCIFTIIGQIRGHHKRAWSSGLFKIGWFSSKCKRIIWKIRIRHGIKRYNSNKLVFFAMILSHFMCLSVTPRRKKRKKIGGKKK